MYSNEKEASDDFYGKKDYQSFFKKMNQTYNANDKTAVEISAAVLNDLALTKLVDSEYAINLQVFLNECKNTYLSKCEAASSFQLADHFSCLVFRLSQVIGNYLMTKVNKIKADQDTGMSTIELMKSVVGDNVFGKHASQWESYRAHAWLAFTYFMNAKLDSGNFAQYHFNKAITIHDKNKREVADNHEEQEKIKSKLAIFNHKLSQEQYQYVNFLYDYSLTRHLDSKLNMYPKTGFNYLKLLSTSEKVLSLYANPETLLKCFMQNAISNCILSNSGGHKSQLINMIYSDVRAKGCANYEIIEKLYKMKFLNDTLKDEFYASEDAPKTQQARLEAIKSGKTKIWGRIDLPDKTNMTNLDRIFLEHDIQVSALYYRDCNMKSLAQRLNTEVKIVEHFLQNMNSRGDIKVSIDHRDDRVTFKKQIQRSEENRIAIQRFCQILQTINQKYVG